MAKQKAIREKIKARVDEREKELKSRLKSKELSEEEYQKRLLKLYVDEAIKIYTEEKGKGKRTILRDNIERIFQTEKNDHDCIVAIQRLFYGPEHEEMRGLLGRSRFIDLMNGAFFLYHADMFKGQPKEEPKQTINTDYDAKALNRAFEIWKSSLERLTFRQKISWWLQGKETNWRKVPGAMALKKSIDLHSKEQGKERNFTVFAQEFNEYPTALRTEILNTQRKYPADAILRGYHAWRAQLKQKDRNSGTVLKQNAFYESVKTNPTETYLLPVDMDPKLAKSIDRADKNLKSSGLDAIQQEELKLKDYYLFAMQRYLDTVLKPSRTRLENIEELRDKIRKFTQSDDDLKSMVEEFFAQKAFTKSTTIGRSKLRDFMQEAYEDFRMRKIELGKAEAQSTSKTLLRNLTVRTWLPQKESAHDEKLQSQAVRDSEKDEMILAIPQMMEPQVKSSKDAEKTVSNANQVVHSKVILAVHGIGDSVDTWEGMVKTWTDAGYTVIAYDQAGHGFDELRADHPRLDLNQMRNDFYTMLRKLQLNEKITDIHVVGHSLGGAVIANSLHTLHSDVQNDNGQMQPSKVRSTVLIAPATMAGATGESISNIPRTIYDTGNMGEDVATVRKEMTEQKRIGGGKLTLRLNAFLNFVSSGFKNLRHYAAKLYEPEKNPIPVKIIAAEADGLIAAENTGILSFWSKLKENKFFKTVIFRSGSHHLHGQGSPMQNLVAQESLDTFKEGEKMFADRENKNLVQPTSPQNSRPMFS